ncbi:MAG: hypothetical protein ACFNUC_06750, partial [Selenomonas noxia]
MLDEFFDLFFCEVIEFPLVFFLPAVKKKRGMSCRAFSLQPEANRAQCFLRNSSINAASFSTPARGMANSNFGFNFGFGKRDDG